MGEEFMKVLDLRSQIYNEAIRQTYEFNLMLVGLEKEGKSTLVKSLYQGKIEPRKIESDGSLNEYVQIIEENGVKLRLRCIETSNFKRHKSHLYADYIESKLLDHFENERLQGREISDVRVHCCLYLIPPYPGLKLKQDDIDCMKMLHDKVNLVPIIARADSFNEALTAEFKENVLADLELNKINYYKFNFDSREDEERSEAVKTLSEKFPFAVIAADDRTEIDGKTNWIRDVRGGKIDVYDQNKSDFHVLSKLLIRHCMLNLIENTHLKHYAKFKRTTLDEYERWRKEKGQLFNTKLDDLQDRLGHLRKSYQNRPVNIISY